MSRNLLLLLILLSASLAFAAQPPVYLWLEPEWFDGVKGGCYFWTGTAKPTGNWGCAGPGVTPEFSQGGESGWNSMAVPAEETKAECSRNLVIPRAGNYRIWVRYYDFRAQTEPFTVKLEQGGKTITGELGMQPVAPPNDEYMLYWGFSFCWAPVEGELQAGPATLRLIVDKAGEAWRQVDAVLITDDQDYTPYGREKPTFAYQSAFALHPGGWKSVIKTGAGWKRPPLGGRDFTMWAGMYPADKDWWAAHAPDTVSKYDLFFRYSPPADIADKFREQFKDTRVPIMAWDSLMPGFGLGSENLAPGTPIRQWLERTKTPFYIMTNYAAPNYPDQTGPATYAALTGPFKDQFMGFIHGEALGTMNGPQMPPMTDGMTRRAYADACIAGWKTDQAKAWTGFFKTPVPESFMSKSISCLSVDSIAFAHMFHEAGCQTVGYELDATNSHAPMRIAFERGAARQYGARWLNYASGNFGDCCNYFTQNPVVSRGAPAWYHSKYAITDGVSIAWYRKFYYLNYLGGASAIFWEQGLGNQWFKPGPGEHPVQLSPFGRATEDFQAFVDRLPDRGEPYTPVAFLLSYGHGYEQVSNSCMPFDKFRENGNDRELRELFNVAWYPADKQASEPIEPDRQSLADGTYGNIFDVLVDRPARIGAVNNYPIVWAAGDVDLTGANGKALEKYVRAGGTLVVNVNAAFGRLPQSLAGVGYTRMPARTCTTWTPKGGTAQPCTPYQVIPMLTAKKTAVLATGDNGVPIITRNQVGKGAVILTAIPGMMGEDEKAHPSLPYLMTAVTESLLPVKVLVNGQRPLGEIAYQLNRTKDGWLVMLMNNHGVDKTQTGIARVDRTAYYDVTLRTALPVKSVREYTGPRDLKLTKGEVTVRVMPGDVQVVGFITK